MRACAQVSVHDFDDLGLRVALPGANFFRRAVLRRSLLCCDRHKIVHFAAVANRQHSSRDRALPSARALRALMQVGHSRGATGLS